MRLGCKFAFYFLLQIKANSCAWGAFYGKIDAIFKKFSF